uniref:hypothetical protein n=1 Tax=Klebsiella pneumoniae TaxID=573 RepID=UPI00187E6908|nr:hypothetical protein [Klebsiella pneumoniae]
MESFWELYGKERQSYHLGGKAVASGSDINTHDVVVCADLPLNNATLGLQKPFPPIRRRTENQAAAADVNS